MFTGVYRAHIGRHRYAGGLFIWDGMSSAVRSAQKPYGESLSERELEVLRLMACGATNQEIAEQLVITVGTVKSHINHIFGKLDAHNRTEAVATRARIGLDRNLT